LVGWPEDDGTNGLEIDWCFMGNHGIAKGDRRYPDYYNSVIKVKQAPLIEMEKSL
jgi:hypothetical protein